MHKKAVRYLLLLLGVPLVVLLGTVAFADKQYAWISLAIAVLSCVPFFLSFERRDAAAKEMTILAVMVALSVAGRFMFSYLPHFKPVTAIVVIAGMYLGVESGFLCGALSAVLSNFIFGQGPWTPFQMFAWGLIGLIAGLLANPLKRHKVFLLLYAAAAGALFSLILDVWTVLWWDGTFNISRYLAAIITALPTTTVYILSNMVFLFFLAGPIGKKLDRVKIKYGLK